MTYICEHMAKHRSYLMIKHRNDPYRNNVDVEAADYRGYEDEKT